MDGDGQVDNFPAAQYLVSAFSHKDRLRLFDYVNYVSDFINCVTKAYIRAYIRTCVSACHIGHHGETTGIIPNGTSLNA